MVPGTGGSACCPRSPHEVAMIDSDKKLNVLPGLAAAALLLAVAALAARNATDEEIAAIA